MNDTRFRVNVLNRHFQRELTGVGGPVKTSRMAAEFAVNAYSNRMNQILRWKKAKDNTVIITVTLDGVDNAPTEYYSVGIANNGSFRIVRDKI